MSDERQLLAEGARELSPAALQEPASPAGVTQAEQLGDGLLREVLDITKVDRLLFFGRERGRGAPEQLFTLLRAEGGKGSPARLFRLDQTVVHEGLAPATECVETHVSRDGKQPGPYVGVRGELRKAAQRDDQRVLRQLLRALAITNQAARYAADRVEVRLEAEHVLGMCVLRFVGHPAPAAMLFNPSFAAKLKFRISWWARCDEMPGSDTR